MCSCRDLFLEKGFDQRVGCLILAVAAASFRGSLATTLVGGSARTRAKRFDAWRADAAAAGFPTAGTEMLPTDSAASVIGEKSFSES